MTKPIWHRPRIVTVEATGPKEFCPPAAQLSLSAQSHRYFNRNEHEAELNRKRQANYQQRNKRDVKKHKRGKPDPFRAITVWLRESEIEESLRDVDLAPLGRPLTSKELREIKSRVITAASRRGLRNK